MDPKRHFSTNKDPFRTKESSGHQTFEGDNPTWVIITVEQFLVEIVLHLPW